MNTTESWWRRVALISALVERAPNQTLGRTAMVKMAYLLQTLHEVPLGYNFRLYTYGPFAPEVLGDIEYAQVLKAVDVHMVYYATGYGYDVRPGPSLESVKAGAADWLDQYLPVIDTVVSDFGGYSAADLELLATIVYADRELLQKRQTVTVAELAGCVREVKPKFTEGYVLGKTKALLDKGVLASIGAIMQRS